MRSLSLVEGEILYQCGLATVGGTGERVLVTTWRYIGKTRKGFTSTDCDIPFQFFEFVECTSFDTSDDNDPSLARNNVFIPSAKQIEDKMLTLQELIEELAFWRDHMGER